ncbi:elongation factor Ts, mitochondrial-like isoform X3 [Mizuhopecten yessoensis]|uniref:Elongation factor Ts, mitochondrial n=1 Tax=Mizuhopecten yessoensis TaxID=6573 RepID=A0A210PG60_MIZYE|nr:elongation factor Ts, mitochondrial-like isoform X3 [Mizuhopecten yessoensis]OWF35480.1 Elongation factor Ts, mitochondrial [Mizuhopecten yessoensis]
MIRNILKPCYNQQFLGIIRSYTTAVDKASLSKLRKKTGIAFMNCRKALEKFDNDIDKAEQWLLKEAQKEGWAKATKLQGRPMSQGLVGVVSDNQRATVVEINCETDFVSKNEKFQDLVSKVASGCHRYFMAAPTSTQICLPKDKLDALDVGNSQSVSDLVALMVGNVGENLSARTVTHVGVTPNSHLETYVHSTGSNVEVDGCRMGKYAVLLDISQNTDGSEEVVAMETMAKQLCQHILGLKPSTVGDFENDKPLGYSEEVKSLGATDDKLQADAENKPLADTDDKLQADKEDNSPKDSDNESDDSDYENDLEETSSKINEDETRLVFQEFLYNPEMVVGEFLKENRATVNKFARFECGEERSTES